MAFGRAYISFEINSGLFCMKGEPFGPELGGYLELSLSDARNKIQPGPYSWKTLRYVCQNIAIFKFKAHKSATMSVIFSLAFYFNSGHFNPGQSRVIQMIQDGIQVSGVILTGRRIAQCHQHSLGSNINGIIDMNQWYTPVCIYVCGLQASMHQPWNGNFNQQGKAL